MVCGAGGGGGGFLGFLGGIFHEGGIVPGPPGADVPIIAQAGERVLPVDQADIPMREVNITQNFTALTGDQFVSMMMENFHEVSDLWVQELYNRGITQTT